MIGLILNLYFLVLCERTFRQDWREGQGSAVKLWLVADPCPPLRLMRLKSEQHTNFQFGKLLIIKMETINPCSRFVLFESE
jgi:hypothetical protein